jgi:hypothetical protein
MSAGDWVVVGVAVLTAALVFVAWLLPKFKKYRLRSPLMKVQPKKHKKTGKKSRKVRRGLTIRIG